MSEHYPQHLEILDRYLADAIERAGRQGLPLDGVLFHAGRLATYHADDALIPFRPTPHFRRWVPLTGPEHAVLARPGQRPLAVRVQPRDFWYETVAPAPSYWQDHVELAEIERFADLPRVTGRLERIAYVGGSAEAADEAGIPPELIEPAALMAPLDWHRATKTEHEVALLKRAVEKAAGGHYEAREAFDAGGSERDAHWSFLLGSEQLEIEVPYETIVAFDEKAAILHYQNKRGGEAAPGRVFLLDAGAAWEGYAIDVTRTWTANRVDPDFLALIAGVDDFQRQLVAGVTAGRPFLEIHLEAHRHTAELLAEVGVFNVDAEEGLERGLTHTFLPHGVGHQLGIQVHDVGGHQAEPDGGVVPPPAEHPMLRNTRTLEPGHVVTIEPGIYFVPLLLEPLRSGPLAALVNWPLVDRLTPHGGIRIEDNVLCTADGPVDLTRGQIPGP